MKKIRQKYKASKREPTRSVPESQTVTCFAPTPSFSAFRVQARWLIRKCVGMFIFIFKFPLHLWNYVVEVVLKVKNRNARWSLVLKDASFIKNERDIDNQVNVNIGVLRLADMCWLRFSGLYVPLWFCEV